jgi:low affinity Fe/Cu permease
VRTSKHESSRQLPSCITSKRDQAGLDMSETFHRLSEAAAKAVGSSWSFLAAVAVVMAWALSGPAFGYSDTWQLLINTGTTVVTFLMVFLIQGSQNRDSKIIGLKLDELLRAVEGARTELLALDHMSDEELEDIKAQFKLLSEKASPLLSDDLFHIDRELKSRRLR